MLRKAISIILITSLLYYTGCASVIQKVPVKDSEYNDIKIAEKIFVTTKDGKEHEVIQFKLTENLLVGKELFWYPERMNKPIEVSLSDIKSVKVLGVRDTQGKIITEEEILMKSTKRNRTVGAILGIISFGIIVALPLYVIATGVGNGEVDSIKIIRTCFLIEFPFLLLGGLLGYKIGENTDKKKAIEKIQQEREQEREKEGKEDKEIKE